MARDAIAVATLLVNIMDSTIWKWLKSFKSENEVSNESFIMKRLNSKGEVTA